MRIGIAVAVPARPPEKKRVIEQLPAHFHPTAPAGPGVEHWHALPQGEQAPVAES